MQDTTIQTEVIIRHTMEDGVTIAILQCHLFQERQQTRKKGSKVVLKRERNKTVYSSVSKNSKSGFKKVKTVKVSKKKSYSFQITKTERKKLKKETYYVQVAPKVKFGNKTYSSDVSTVASAYVYK